MTEADYLRTQARECRDAARRAHGSPDARSLLQLARYYEGQAAKLDSGSARVMHIVEQARMR